MNNSQLSFVQFLRDHLYQDKMGRKDGALLEGLIKVPESTHDQAMNIVLEDFYSRIVGHLEAIDADDLLLAVEKSIKKFQGQYGRFQIDTDITPTQWTVKPIYLRLGEIDPRYMKKKSNKIVKINLHVYPNNNPNTKNPSGEYQAQSDRDARTPNHIDVILPGWNAMKTYAENPGLVENMVGELSGVVRHELMHVIQKYALSDDWEVDYLQSSGDVDDDKYYINDGEFNPLIVTVASQFISVIRTWIEDLGGIDKATKTQLIKDYTTPHSGKGTIGTHLFFVKLYEKDKEKWKKAVKYFYSLVSTKI